MVITIDGPAGSGKSTISNLLAKKINAKYINSGAFYRAITYVALDLNTPLHTNERFNQKISEEEIPFYIEKIIPTIKWEDSNIHISYTLHDASQKKVVLDEELFTDRIDSYVAEISTIVPLRLAINKRIQEICQKDGNWIIEGRDAGKNIYPNAEFKFYLDASLEVRAARRNTQYDNNTLVSHNLKKHEVSEIMKKRDEIDRSKGAHSLTITDNARYIDTTNYTIEEIIDKVYNIINI